MKQFHSRVNRQNSIHNIDPGISLTVLLLLDDDRITIIEPQSKSIEEMWIISPNLEFVAIPQLFNWSNEIEGLKRQIAMISYI
jgi:hypothetical protein